MAIRINSDAVVPDIKDPIPGISAVSPEALVPNFHGNVVEDTIPTFSLNNHEFVSLAGPELDGFVQSAVSSLGDS